MNLETKLGYTFRDPKLLELALTHPSWGHEQGRRLPHNERLEFLGDAVLELAISEHLYCLYPEFAEGHLTKMRAHLASRDALVEMAEALELGGYLRLGEAEAVQGGRRRPSNLANALEATIGAIFLDGGYKVVSVFVVQQIERRLKQLAKNPEPENAKGILQEKLHALGQMATYRILSEKGPAHRKQFEATVEMNGKILGTGLGNTKKEAEKQAAMVALTVLQSSESADDAS